MFREVDSVLGGGQVSTLALDEPDEQPLMAPVTRAMSWNAVHAYSQTPPREPSDLAGISFLAEIRLSAKIRVGTRMIKVLSARQFGAYLQGRRPGGFCYRAYDLVGLRTTEELAMLTGDAGQPDPTGGRIVYGLRWRAVDPADYHVPFSAPVKGLAAYHGINSISPHDRIGPPVLGTGFAPSQHHVVPEFVTADLCDLPMPAGTSLVAFTPDGHEVGLYLYVPEQRGWARMFGPNHKHLVAGLHEVRVDQEYVPMTFDYTGGSTLVGQYRGESYEALADPNHGFRVLARARAARYP